MRLGTIVAAVALLAPTAVAATLATGQAAAIRIDGDGLACATTAPVALSDDGAGRIQLLVVDMQRCVDFPPTWTGCRYNEGFRVSCLTPDSRLLLTFEDELRVDRILAEPPRPSWHHLEAQVQMVT